MHHIVYRLSGRNSGTKGRISQNGVKYRTLCSRCNNSLLGAIYDPELIAFVNEIGTYLKTNLYLPSNLFVKARPQKIMRSVLGHISAQGVGRYQKGSLTGVLRDYFLDETLPLPNGIKIYYWLFPFGQQVLIRDAAYVDTRVQQPVAFWLLKFFPLAFMVTWEEPVGYNFNVHSFDSWRSTPMQDIADLPIRFTPTIHQFWPEAPTGQSVIMVGQEAVVAFNRPKR
jgi:hypothetical protein